MCCDQDCWQGVPLFAYFNVTSAVVEIYCELFLSYV